MQKINRKGIKAGVYFGIFLVCFILLMNIQIEEEPRWQVIWKGSLAEAVEASPGAGVTGFLEFFFINHSANPATDYVLNDSSTFETWCTANDLFFANADEFHGEIASEVSGDFLVRVQFNKTHCWDVDKFIGARTRVKITVTSSDWADGENIADAEGTRYESYNNTGVECIYENFVWDADDNNGYQLADDGTITISEISIEAEF